MPVGRWPTAVHVRMPWRLPAAPSAAAGPAADFWQPDAGTPILTVDDVDSLRKAGGLLQAACIIGIDCEWQPGSARPSATLLQLAVRTDADKCVVLILVRLAPSRLVVRRCTAVHEWVIAQREHTLARRGLPPVGVSACRACHWRCMLACRIRRPSTSHVASQKRVALAPMAWHELHALLPPGLSTRNTSPPGL